MKRREARRSAEIENESKGSSRMSLPRKKVESLESHRRQKGDVGALSEYLLITLSEHNSPAAEAFRILRTNLLYAFVDAPPRTIMLTSPGPREGKSTICANLGVVLGQASKRTLIVDCDFRGPVQHEILGLSDSRGIVNVLAGDYELHDVRQETPVPNLSVLPVGPIPPNPTELLGSRTFAKVLDRARREFEYVLIDAPPTQPVSDALILASQVDGVLLVIDAGSTQKEAIRRSMRSLEAVGANVLGTVMNNAIVPEESYYGGGTYGYVK
jgi:capsular exopolysaccharide synthesis family protein